MNERLKQKNSAPKKETEVPCYHSYSRQKIAMHSFTFDGRLPNAVISPAFALLSPRLLTKGYRSDCFGRLTPSLPRFKAIYPSTCFRFSHLYIIYLYILTNSEKLVKRFQRFFCKILPFVYFTLPFLTIFDYCFLIFAFFAPFLLANLQVLVIFAFTTT